MEVVHCWAPGLLFNRGLAGASVLFLSRIWAVMWSRCGRSPWGGGFACSVCSFLPPEKNKCWSDDFDSGAQKVMPGQTYYLRALGHLSEENAGHLPNSQRRITISRLIGQETQSNSGPTVMIMTTVNEWTWSINST